MPTYYVNKNAQTGCNHAMHKESCVFMPEEGNRMCLGNFESSHSALLAAREHYSDTDACYFCCKERNKELT